MTVDELLRKISSRELTEWAAFERINGPLGSQYGDDMLANIHEQLQAVQYIVGKMAAGEDSIVPLPHRMPRPSEVFAPDRVPDDDQDDTDDAQALQAEAVAQGRVEKQELPGM